MLFVTWVADPFRPTRDLDLLGHGANDAEAIAETFRDICAQPVADDGVTFDVAALTAVPTASRVRLTFAAACPESDLFPRPARSPRPAGAVNAGASVHSFPPARSKKS
jgi:hypothetical protein